MVSVHHLAGRLGLCQFYDAFDVSGMAKLRAELMSLFNSVEGKTLIFTDMSKIQQLDDDVKAPLTALLRADNPRVERNALLVTRGTPLVLQAHNILRGADSRARRVFMSPGDVEEWLSELASTQELDALRKTLRALSW